MPNVFITAVHVSRSGGSIEHIDRVWYGSEPIDSTTNKSMSIAEAVLWLASGNTAQGHERVHRQHDDHPVTTSREH